SIAAQRGRSAAALEATIFDAKSYTADEALEADIIDIVASDMDDLLNQLDSMTIALGGESVSLDTSGIEIREINPNAIESFLDVIANPNVAFLLLTLGGVLIIIELLNPGVILPGTFGTIALALGLLGAANLPVNWIGVGLIGLAMVLFFFELQAPGLGVFVIGGAVSFLLGAFLLFGGISAPPLPDAPSFRVNLWFIGLVAAAMLGVVFFLLRAVREAKKAPEYHLGGGSLVGKVGVAVTPLNPRGTVQVAGEQWSAASDNGEGIEKGEEVIVLETEGLTLRVFRAHESLSEEMRS
ncbi:MAG: NfeD family protein, partial [Ardenticatenaceae bacterium]